MTHIDDSFWEREIDESFLSVLPFLISNLNIPSETVGKILAKVEILIREKLTSGSSRYDDFRFAQIGKLLEVVEPLNSLPVAKLVDSVSRDFVTDWSRDSNSISKLFSFLSFIESIEFVENNRIIKLIIILLDLIELGISK